MELIGGMMDLHAIFSDFLTLSAKPEMIESILASC